MILFEYDLLFYTLQAHNACTKICLDLRIQHFYFFYLLWEFLRILYKPDGAHYCRRNLQFLSFTYCNECRNVLQKDQMAEQREVINSLCASLKKRGLTKTLWLLFQRKIQYSPPKFNTSVVSKRNLASYTRVSFSKHVRHKPFVLIIIFINTKFF